MSIAENLKSIEMQVLEAAQSAGRSMSDVTLVAVSKKQPDERVDAALDAGHRVFGENRVQEAMQRWGSFEQGRRAEYSDLVLHLIGPLQSNKAKEAVALFDVIETVDREKIAKALATEMQKQDRHLPCLVQVNTGSEPQKSGIAPDDVRDFVRYCADECGLNIQGLMCIPPIDEPAALHFALLKKYRDALGLPFLSMGMSSDFEKAIALGATHIRVGTGVFGERPVQV